MECSDKCLMRDTIKQGEMCPFMGRDKHYGKCLYSAVHKFQMEREAEVKIREGETLYVCQTQTQCGKGSIGCKHVEPHTQDECDKWASGGYCPIMKDSYCDEI